MILFAHRGFSSRYPENTLLAFQRAVDFGARALECDVQLSRDGIPVILHDETLDRTSSGSGLVCDFSLAELKEMNFSVLHPEYSPQPICTLEELCRFCRDHEQDLLLNIELKNDVLDHEGLAEAVLNVLRPYAIYLQTLFSSFNHEGLAYLKKLAPDSVVAPLFNQEADYLNVAHTLGAKAIHLSRKLLTNELLQKLKEDPMALHVYTVNDVEDAKALAMAGVNGIFTDDIQTMRAKKMGLI